MRASQLVNLAVCCDRVAARDARDQVGDDAQESEACGFDFQGPNKCFKLQALLPRNGDSRKAK